MNQGKKMMENPYSCLFEDIVVQGKTDTTHGRRPDFPEHQSFET
jgi:hypothetical protein